MTDIFTHSFTNIDWFAVGLLTLGFFWGFSKGFVRELMSIASWFFAFIFAPLWGATAGSLKPVQDMSQSVRLGAGYTIVFVGVLIASTFLGNSLRKLLSTLGLGILDSLVGAIFGMLGSVVVLLLFTICVNLSPFKTSIEWTHSNFAPVLLDLLHHVISFLPSSFERLNI